MSNQISLKTIDGKPFEITEKGSLGLLALGHIGLILWREKRKEIQHISNSNSSPDSPTKSPS